MRVITGTARGCRLAAPEGLQTRPTSDMAKEAMFSIVQFEVEQAEVLDLCAGSGQLGIEALSRGARRAVFVDSSREAEAAILQNLRKTRLLEKARVVRAEASAFLASCADRFDLVFFDPPYGRGFLDQLLPAVALLVRREGIILCESERREALPDAAGAFTRKKEYFYGKAKVTTYRLPEESRK